MLHILQATDMVVLLLLLLVQHLLMPLITMLLKAARNIFW
jgi:hypothetical protein